jgi:hypothetical protein
VWIIYPSKRESCAPPGEEPPEVYTETQSVQAESLFPGLSIKVADLLSGVGAWETARPSRRNRILNDDM